MADDIQLNLEAIREEVASIQLAQNRDSLALYGNPDINFEGLIKKTDRIELDIKAINGMPKKMESLSNKVDCLVETDKKRQWLFRGIVLGIGFQVGSALGLLDLIKGLL